MTRQRSPKAVHLPFDEELDSDVQNSSDDPLSQLIASEEAGALVVITVRNSDGSTAVIFHSNGD